MKENKAIILVSSFQTWSGKRYSAPIVDIEKHFASRSASQACSQCFLLENNFFNACKLMKRSCIMGGGLVYGANGIDFENAFT